MAERLRPSDVAGVPIVPPGRVTAGANRFRSVVGRVHRASAPPPVQILEAVFGRLDHAALVALCQVGVPEHLTKRTTVAALALATGTDPVRLERLLRYAASRGWVGVGRRRVRPTAMTAFLRPDHPGGWRAWVDFAGDAGVGDALDALGAGLAGGASAFERANGAPFFAWTAAHPSAGAVFDAAMDAGGRLHALTLAAALDWASTRRVCDVGGGSGALLAGLLGEHPHLEGVVLDLPEVVARAPERPGVTFVAGDAFVAVPEDADTFLLVNVLHDWGDEESVAILRRVAAALPPDGRIVVVDGERARRPADGITARTDLLMLALTGDGKERTTAEFAALASRSGLALTRSVRLASGDRAHVLTRPAASS